MLEVSCDSCGSPDASVESLRLLSAYRGCPTLLVCCSRCCLISEVALQAHRVDELLAAGVEELPVTMRFRVGELRDTVGGAAALLARPLSRLDLTRLRGGLARR